MEIEIKISDGSTFSLKNHECYNMKGVVLASHHMDQEEKQCSSVNIQRINAPASAVWSVVRRFDKPETYKPFISSCSVKGDVKVGCVREVKVVSGLPAKNSIERLEILDEEKHILSFRVLGGEHRLRNYQSVTTLNEFVEEGRVWTNVVEYYVTDIPEGNSREDTCTFIDTIVRCNLQSLSKLFPWPTSQQSLSKLLPWPTSQQKRSKLPLPGAVF